MGGRPAAAKGYLESLLRVLRPSHLAGVGRALGMRSTATTTTRTIAIIDDHRHHDNAPQTSEPTDFSSSIWPQKASQLAGQYTSKMPQLVGNLGGKVNGLLGSYSGPISYNYQFVKEVLKQVYIKENLAPPRLKQIQTSYLEIFKNLSSLNFWKKNLESGDWKRLSVYGIEAVGLFSIGEMIGRRHLVGYKLD
ncbi:hypothetical protein O181_056517 [Austropuccinia psidii MF-1]|uniref:Uncharacterized protein n=1 Tax=Austropuccinia psidii MF-1 TaxID=1389203 RepID=A0A9Q3EAX8_9BASI|nr:hypothetical protein [Austropuccinia psidii MF-1]